MALNLASTACVAATATSGRYVSQRHRRGAGRAWLFAGTFALLASARSWAETPNSDLLLRTGAGNPAAGKEKSDSERCQECHGSDGNSGDTRIPNHAGQTAAYLVKQLADFQSGARSHDVMNRMAADLSVEDMADIAAYFAAQAPKRGDGNANNLRGQALFSNGDAARNLPACGKCHGDLASGRIADNVAYPRLAGQRKVYLRTQLVNWRLGERRNSPNGVMNAIATKLSDDDIDALVDYLAGL